MENALDVVIPCHHARLMQRLNQMRLAGRYCDVHFKIGDTLYHAHRVVLAAQAEIFHDLFQIDILEREEEVISMDNVDAQVFMNALNYLYVGQHHIPKVPAAQRSAAGDERLFRHLSLSAVVYNDQHKLSEDCDVGTIGEV